MKFIPLLIIFSLNFLSICHSEESDTYDAIEQLTSKERLPRLLNSVDLPEISSDYSLPTLSMEGDFNSDGVQDLAVSGVFDLEGNGKKFFFLIATKDKKTTYKFIKLFYEESDRPYLLHLAGTTGSNDPGDQAFSLTFCQDCNDGYDVYWEPKKNRFSFKKWDPTGRALLTRPMQVEKKIELSQKEIEAALKVVGDLNEVKEFVQELKKRKASLVARAEGVPNKKNQALVHILEKNGEQEKLFKTYSVDLKHKKLI